MATIQASGLDQHCPPADTPCHAESFPARSHADEQAQSARSAWRSVTPSLAGTPHVRISKDGGRTYPARHARRLPADPPGQPCAVPVYDAGSASGRMLALDLDVSRGDVDRQGAELGQLLEDLGGQVLADVSPSGGRHVFIVFAAPLDWRELRDMSRAIALRYPAVDPGPHASLCGQISPPGSRGKRGGWRLLTSLLEDAAAAVEYPNGPEVWAGLLSEFAAELQQAESAPACRPDQVAAELDDAGVPWVPRLGGRASLGAELEQTARTGRWDRTRYPGRSEARMAVLGSLAARGWQLAEVRAAIACGAWKGLAELYARRSEPGRMDRLLPAEWRKCVGKISREKNGPTWHTSDLSTRPPTDADGLAAEYGLIRAWLTVLLIAAEDPERVKGWGRRAIAVRLVLLALGQAAMVSGSSTIEFGCRNIALYSCLSHRTVARVLRMLANEDDPLIDLVSARQMARADRYALRIPDRYVDSVRWRRRRAGRIEAAHPAFLVLGGTSALVYLALDQAEARGAEVARAARLSASATSAALQLLAEYGLAERGTAGWRRGPVALADVAEATGAAELQREREVRYKQDRESWRARLRQYQGTRAVRVDRRDGWLSLDDGDEYDELSRWPVLSDDFVRGPPSAEVRDIA